MRQTQHIPLFTQVRSLTQRFKVASLLNRNLPSHIRISFSVGWGLAILPIAVFNQIFAPHAIWMVLVIVLSGLYGMGYWWVRNQATRVTVTRHRIGPVLVAGDRLQEEFNLSNQSRFPILWAELVDRSEVPKYQPGRVVACGGMSGYRWHSDVECRRRGIFRVGPHMLLFGDPFGLFRVSLSYDHTDIVIIYPKVVEIPPLELPLGGASGANRRRLPLPGPHPASSVADYRPGDSLRYIHWRTTAHRGRLTVKELELEPSGDVWIVLDLNRHVHSGKEEDSTLEFCIVMAASLAAELLTGAERRAVGLLTTSGKLAVDLTDMYHHSYMDGVTGSQAVALAHTLAVAVPPQTGSAQLWSILGTLASVEAADVNLVQLLRSMRDMLGQRRSIFVITPDVVSQAGGDPVGLREPIAQAGLDGRGARTRSSTRSTDGGSEYETDDWVAELLHMKSGGLPSSVLLVEPEDGVPGDGERYKSGDRVRSLLAGQEIPTRIVQVDSTLRTVVTFRRTRQVIRSTPTGGAVMYDVEEDIG